MKTVAFGSALAVLVAAAASGAEGPASEPSRQAQAAMATIIHVTAEGSEVLRGNGFLVAADGVLVTNYHLVQEAERLQIQLANGDVYDQVLVRGLDPKGDLAALKIPAFNAPFVALSRRAPPEPGERVLLTSRAGPGTSPPAPQASVIGRQELAPGLDLVLLDRSLDASTKGAPVLGTNGECVGVTTLSYRAGASTGVAVAVNRVMDLLDQDLNRPLELVDWSAQGSPETLLRDELKRLGLRRQLPPAALRKEKSLGRRLEMALEFDPTDQQAKALLARAYMQQREYAKASSQIAELLARDPSAIPILALKGDLLRHTGDYDGARELYRKVVDGGYQSPDSYDKQLHGVRAVEALHDHFMLACSGPIVMGTEKLAYQPPLLNDRYSVEYGGIKKLTVKSAQKAGQTVYELAFEFMGPVPNQESTAYKTELELRVAEREARDNLCAYLRKRGVTVTEEP